MKGHTQRSRHRTAGNERRREGPMRNETDNSRPGVRNRRSAVLAPHGGRVVRLSEVLEITRLSRTTIWRREREESFPSLIRLGGEHTRAVGWREQDSTPGSRAYPRQRDYPPSNEAALESLGRRFHLHRNPPAIGQTCGYDCALGRCANGDTAGVRAGVDPVDVPSPEPTARPLSAVSTSGSEPVVSNEPSRFNVLGLFRRDTRSRPGSGR